MSEGVRVPCFPPKMSRAAVGTVAALALAAAVHLHRRRRQRQLNPPGTGENEEEDVEDLGGRQVRDGTSGQIRAVIGR